MLACKYFEVAPKRRCSIESEFEAIQILGFCLYVSERTHWKYVNSLRKHYFGATDKENNCSSRDRAGSDTTATSSD